MIAGRRFALSSGERVFLTGFRMEKDGEVLSDLPVAQCDEFVGRRAHDAPITLPVRNAELFVPNSATNEVYLHCAIVPDNRG